MSALNSAISNHRWALTANVLQALVSWLLLFILIRLGNKEDVGLYSYMQALLLPVQLFFTLKLRVVQCSDALNEHSASEYHRVRSVSALLSMLVGVLVLALMAGDKKVTIGGMILLVSYAVYILRESYISVFQKNNNNRAFFLINLSGGLFSVVLFLFAFLIYKDLLVSLLFLAVGRVISYLTVERHVFRLNSCGEVLRWTGSFLGSNSLKSILKISWPLGVSAMLAALFTSIPKVIIKTEMGYESLAVYAAVSSLLVAFNLLVNSFAQSALPNLSRDYSDDIESFFLKVKAAIFRIVMLSFGAAIGAFLVGEYFLLVLFGPEYRYYVNELVLVVVCGFSLSLFSVTNLMLSSQRTFFAQFPIYLLCCISIVVFSFIGVNLYGISGALIAQALGYILGGLISLQVFNMRKG